MNRGTFHLTSLGCAKNAVDSESMAHLLEHAGYRRLRSAGQAEILIVNTCGFIALARQESYEVLRALAEAKQPGQLLIAAGCLTQRYGMEVIRQAPGIDAILGTRRWMDIVQVVNRLRAVPSSRPLCHFPEAPTIGAEPVMMDGLPVRRACVAGSSAYLKIADGCRRSCAFCAIPLIKGPPVSRPLDVIVEEARQLHEQGVREIVLIAQDTTDYGCDLHMKDGLPALLERITAAVPTLDWLRILYTFPGYITDRLIKVMVEQPQVLPYLDIPLQHAHPATLTRMRRPADIRWVYSTIAKMREALPRLAIRTTFIVGYPGETEEEFQTLLDFVKEMRFDRVGTFQYSWEQGTAAETLGDPVPPEVKEERYQRLMEIQQAISLEINQSFVGQTLDVLVEGYNKGYFVGRSYRDAPEIDGVVFIEGASRKEIEIGNIVPVEITGAMAYDLRGILKKQPRL